MQPTEIHLAKTTDTALSGLTAVVSLLLSLMQNQVSSLAITGPQLPVTMPENGGAQGASRQLRFLALLHWDPWHVNLLACRPQRGTAVSGEDSTSTPLHCGQRAVT